MILLLHVTEIQYDCAIYLSGAEQAEVGLVVGCSSGCITCREFLVNNYQLLMKGSAACN
jgi:hypothetical protein